MDIAGFSIGFVALIVYLALFVVWILTLVKQAKGSKWVWFVLTLIFPIVALVYWIVKWVK